VSEDPLFEKPVQSAGQSGTRRVLIAMPLLILLLPGLLEFAGILRATLCLNSLAREAASMASVGAAPRVIDAAVDSCREGVDGRFVECMLLRSHWDPGREQWCPWSRLGSREGENDAELGDRLRVTLECDYQFVLGSLTARFFGGTTEGTTRLESTATVRRL
jgi:hypothetical protein